MTQLTETDKKAIDALLSKLGEWDALAKASTEGPWQSKKGYVGANHAAFLSNDGLYDGLHIHWGEERHGKGTEESFATAAFMAHGDPEFVQQIIAEIRGVIDPAPTTCTGCGGCADSEPQAAQGLPVEEGGTNV